jgi:ABC-type amino acid transport substrate-binding protein
MARVTVERRMTMLRVRSAVPRDHRAGIASSAIAWVTVVLLALAVAAPASAGALDQVKKTGRIRLGYRTDARPLSYADESGKPAGYSVALCERIVGATKADLGLADLPIDWVPVTIESRFRAVQQGDVDLLCGAETATLARRGEVDFSIPTFPGGIGALVRADAPARLREVLSGRPAQFRPYWRGTAGQILQVQTFSIVAGATSESWLAGRLKEFQLTATVAPVESYEAGVRRVLDRSSNVFFGDRAILMDAVRRNASGGDLVVLDRLFTSEPLALALARGDEDFRLVVDRTLSRLYRSGEIGALYAKWCGEPDENALTFFRLTALPE